jgi:hypothetical protein
VTRVRLTQLARAGQFASAKLLLTQALACLRRQAGALLFGNPNGKKNRALRKVALKSKTPRHCQGALSYKGEYTTF